MKTAIITLTEKGGKLGAKLNEHLADSELFVSDGRLPELVEKLFKEYKGLIFCMAAGITVRMINGLLKDKYTDPAVVVVDDAGRYAISLLSGHEGGANKLAVEVANIIGAESVVTTASESGKNIIIGIGCMRGAGKENIISAIETALGKINGSAKDIRLISTVDIKRDEKGLIEACRSLGVPLKIVSSDVIRNFNGEYARSAFVHKKIGLEGVCEPCALLAGKSAELVLPKTVVGKVTVAAARENSV